MAEVVKLAPKKPEGAFASRLRLAARGIPAGDPIRLAVELAAVLVDTPEEQGFCGVCGRGPGDCEETCRRAALEQVLGGDRG
jgi:hypothetical protein